MQRSDARFIRSTKGAEGTKVTGPSRINSQFYDIIGNRSGKNAGGEEILLIIISPVKGIPCMEVVVLF
jgi:hypothetical protein